MIIPMDNINIPEELVSEILSRLPVRSLLRFKCVCKPWCNRISAKDFTFLHLNNYKPSDLVFAGLSGGLQSRNLSIANVSPLADLPFVSRPRIVNYPLPQQHDFDKIWASVPVACGPCNGIFCLYRHEKESILLWNPQIQDIKVIPQSSLPRHQVTQGQRSPVKYRVGFGFDSKTNDYKILQIVRNDDIYDQQQQQLELFSLGSNSWKKLDYASPLNIFCISSSRLFTAQRKIGWLGFKRQICLFDLSDETFDMIPISIDCDVYRADLEVFPFRESIAALISIRGYCEIWVLNNLSCTRSRTWSKLWTIKLANFNQPIGFCGNSYLIFRPWESFSLKLYHLPNHDVVDVGASILGRALVYKESLVTISCDKHNTKKKS